MDSTSEQRIADCLEDYQRRRAKGERPTPDLYRERLAASFDEFLEVLAGETALDEALATAVDSEAPATLPREFGGYTLLRELGRGSVGVVYEAHHAHLARRVAVKVLRTGFDTDAGARDRFLREAQACAQVRHDNIVEIYDAGEAEGRPFYSMTLVEGPTLGELIRCGARPDPLELCRGLAGIAGALHELHEAGVVHRDIKPSNIIVATGGRMVLADFGLARTALASTLTRSGAALGTPLYMSPEQMLSKREEVDGRSDIYGLGATMYEALCGKPPFQADDLQRLMGMVLSERPMPFKSRGVDVPLEAGNIALKCLEKERTDRYPTAKDFQADLQAFCEGRPVSARPLSRVRLAARKIRRHPRLTLAVALAIVLPLLWVLLRPAPTPALAKLDVSPWPPGTTVRIDGGAPTKTPLRSHLLTPNEPHKLLFEAEGFLPHAETLHPEPGRRYDLDPILRLSMSPSGDSMPHVLERLGLDQMRYRLTPLPDDLPHVPLQILSPRGKVRRIDLGKYRIHVDDDFDEQVGWLEFRAGSELVARMPFDPSNTRSVGDMPREVARLPLGTTVTWGYHAPEGRRKPITATFTLVDANLRDVLEAADHILTDPEVPQSRPRATLIRARIYAAHDLDLAAYWEARTVWGQHGTGQVSDAQALEALVLQRECMLRMAGDDLAQIAASQEWKTLESLLAEPWSDLARLKVFGD